MGQCRIDSRRADAALERSRRLTGQKAYPPSRVIALDCGGEVHRLDVVARRNPHFLYRDFQASTLARRSSARPNVEPRLAEQVLASKPDDLGPPSALLVDAQHNLRTHHLPPSPRASKDWPWTAAVAAAPTFSLVDKPSGEEAEDSPWSDSSFEVGSEFVAFVSPP